jgi:hypothetical protein
MNKKVLQMYELDLDEIDSWVSILQTSEEEFAKTKLTKWSPKDLYALEMEDPGAFQSVWSTVPVVWKVQTRLVFEYLSTKHRNQCYEEDKRRDLEKIEMLTILLGFLQHRRVQICDWDSATYPGK